MCRLFSGPVQAPAPELLPNPGLGRWGLTCPRAVGPSYLLPCNYTASISHSGSKGRSRAKPMVPQSLASHIPNCWCSWGKDRKHPAHSPQSPFPVAHTTVLPALQDGWSCIHFSGHSQAGQSSDGFEAAAGSPGPRWVPVLTLLSPCQSGNALLQPCSLQDPAVWRQATAVSPPSQSCSSSVLNPMEKADSTPGSHWDSVLPQG